MPEEQQSISVKAYASSMLLMHRISIVQLHKALVTGHDVEMSVAALCFFKQPTPLLKGHTTCLALKGVLRYRCIDMQALYTW